jgi:hypothetical protein
LGGGRVGGMDFQGVIELLEGRGGLK